MCYPQMDAVLGQYAQLDRYQKTGNPADFPGMPGTVGHENEKAAAVGGVEGSRIRQSDTASRLVDTRQGLASGLGTTGTAARGTVLGSTT